MTLSPQELRLAYDRDAAGYDARFKALQVVKYDAIAERFSPAKGARILDLGCGTGMLMRRLDGLRPVGLDLSWQMLRRAPAGRRVQASLLDLPFAPRCFDVVFAVTALLLTPRLTVCAFAEIGRVLAPGGTLALTILEREVYDGLEEDLGASGINPGDRFACGQDVGWIARRVG